ncbi:accessory factor UbiK family protein [Teredinibacter haidensis]|uniref:accessory factor UbiK family protein n=1 Tax=Teredinibacter haidensis TaxID=2731755 RepID=UPI000948F2CD|nr:accessory factor UbiK family protein [Teredinibacter haidensis]
MIDQLAKQLFSEFNEKVSGFSSGSMEASSQLRAIIESALRKLNLVTRDEFDAQQAVLLRTREKLDALELKLAELENEQKPQL